MNGKLLNAELRTETGKNSCNRLRVEGYIPAVVYSHGKSDVIKIKEKEFGTLFKGHISESVIFNLHVNGAAESDMMAFVKDYQAHPVTGRIKYIFTPLAIIDLLAILPFYLPFMNIDFRFIRSIRLTRLFRIAKLGRYSVALEAMNIAIKRKKEQLIITVGILLFFLLLSSSLLYYTEYEAQPDKFTSIPHAMWWGIATLTTVGYGDIYPVTTAGKIISSLIAIIGVGICALPTGIISAGFLENIRNNQESTKVCPHCGKEII